MARMDTIAPKTPATLPFSTWAAMSPNDAAHEVHRRIAALPDALRKAAIASLRPETELAAELAASSPDQPFHGLPYFLKDLFDHNGFPTRAGSTFLDQVRPTPTRDSQIAQQFRARGASCAGKSQLVEFASGLTGENPHYGDCPHPQFPDRLSGGSSSGSAALVASGVVPLAVGTDTGGSVRVPAAFCGLYGFRGKPRDALIADAFPLAPTMDTAGWFTTNAPDMLTSWQAMVPGPRAESKLHGCYLPMGALLKNSDPETARACDAAAARICPPADARSQSQLLDSWQGAVDAYLTIGMSEANAVHREWLAPYREHYDPLVWQRFHDAASYPAEKILHARTKLKEIWMTWRHFFLSYDYLILPAAPCPAPRKADCTVDLRRSIIQLTAPASLGGLPVLSIPVPMASGLTAGLQIIVPVANSAVIPWILSQ
jgi:Asp-tRNA(Asn)/Glu-tRNA(Gln) amidotransferase A subunit family amidase